MKTSSLKRGMLSAMWAKIVRLGAIGSPRLSLSFKVLKQGNHIWEELKGPILSAIFYVLKQRKTVVKHFRIIRPCLSEEDTPGLNS